MRNRLLEDEASSPYLQRKHLVLKDDRLPTLARQHQLSDSVPYSVSDSVRQRAEGPIPASVQEKMKEARENA